MFTTLMIITLLLSLIQIILLNREVRKLKAKINDIVINVNIPDSYMNKKKLYELIIIGNDVEAIKEVRQSLGLSLIDAKNYVDNIRQEINK